MSSYAVQQVNVLPAGSQAFSVAGSNGGLSRMEPSALPASTLAMQTSLANLTALAGYAANPGALNISTPALNITGLAKGMASLLLEQQPGEEVRTIFVTGFPPDVNLRELHTLVRFFPGYEASQMLNKLPGGGSTGPQGFALFSTQAHARAAMARIDDLAFDKDYHLRVELAHKNMYLKDDPTIYRADRPSNSPSPVPSQTAPVGGFAPISNRFDNLPCNTLFIGNLGDNVDEAELQSLFAQQQGFKQLKLIRNPRQVSCFVEYLDLGSASRVHNLLQGAVLASSDRGPIRVQYSKNPFGKRNNPLSSAAAASLSMSLPAPFMGTALHGHRPAGLPSHMGGPGGLMPDFSTWPANPYAALHGL